MVVSTLEMINKGKRKIEGCQMSLKQIEIGHTALSCLTIQSNVFSTIFAFGSGWPLAKMFLEDDARAGKPKATSLCYLGGNVRPNTYFSTQNSDVNSIQEHHPSLITNASTLSLQKANMKWKILIYPHIIFTLDRKMKHIAGLLNAKSL